MPSNLKNKLASVAALGAFSLAIVLIRYFEGIEYYPYYDVAGVLTVCYGHTGDDIEENKQYSQQQCEAWLHADLLEKKKEVDPLLTALLPETTLAALYSFAYNVGTPAFAQSTLLKKLNAGQKNCACHELKRWIYAAGTPWRGLMTRRAVEEAICHVNEISEL